MTKTQGPSSTERNAAKREKKDRSPLSPGFDKKLDGPNRPST
ncbi:spore protein [Cohnella lupini]|uniref:Spore protein n=1 Tax=Cohnella lupini TaxID=1294267 RepID=A0A3D9IMX5_9BACL|nr:spore protein [Cohnella lupini]RED63134.1 hypothetical protein DFP95_104128 [Cohnella lupini]